MFKPKSFFLMPLMLLAACSQEPAGPGIMQASASAAPADSTAAPAAIVTAATTQEPSAGERTYKQTCAMCHASGVAGAPIPGVAADWESRIAQGKEALYRHALEGFTGEKGMMPAKGGNPSLSDDQVRATVDHMVSQAR